MRRGISLLALCAIVAGGFAAQSARADGNGTTTSDTTTTSSTTTSTTTTSTTTTTTAPSYAPLSPSPLPSGCVAAGAAAIVSPTGSVSAFGLAASSLGPSSYAPSGATILSFDAASASGSCGSGNAGLASVSLFDGSVSASGVEAANGSGTVTGLEVDGQPVSAGAGQTVAVDGWGLLRLGGTVGRITAPLVLRLVQAHDSLPAGTSIAVAFSASALHVVKPKHPRPKARPTKHHARSVSHTRKHARAARHHRSHHTRRPAKRLRRDEFWAHYRFPAGGLVPGARKNAVVSLTRKYLGIPYVWAGARPRTGFDCSGLVQYVFARLGVLLPHNAAAQWHSVDTRWVRPSRMQPGDLVFFKSDGTWDMPGHVGIYIGGGEIIDAPHTGSFVRIDSFSDAWFAQQFVGAKRVIGVELTGERAPVPALTAIEKLRSRARKLEHHHVPAPAKSAPRQSTTLLGQLLTPPFAALAAPRKVAQHSAVPTSSWVGVGFGSALLVALPGVFTYRRRRSAPAAEASSE